MTDHNNASTKLFWKVHDLTDENGLTHWQMGYYDQFHTGPKSWLVQPEHFVVSTRFAAMISSLSDFLKEHPDVIVEDVPKEYQKVDEAMKYLK